MLSLVAIVAIVALVVLVLPISIINPIEQDTTGKAYPELMHYGSLKPELMRATPPPTPPPKPILISSSACGMVCESNDECSGECDLCIDAAGKEITDDSVPIIGVAKCRSW